MKGKTGICTILSVLLLLFFHISIPSPAPVFAVGDSGGHVLEYPAEEEPDGESIPQEEEATQEPGPEEREQSVLGQSPPSAVPVQEVLSAAELGNWTSYNGIIFGDAQIYQSRSGGGLAVGGDISLYNNFAVGSTYTAEYDPTRHIGEYTNEGGFPALLLAGENLDVSGTVTALDVYGGPVTMTAELLEQNSQQPAGFVPRTDSYYQTADKLLLEEWFAHQHSMARASSQMMLQGNSTTIDITQLSSGEYLEAGPDAYRNQFFQVNGEVYQNALFITVRTGGDLNLGQWWPVHSIVYMDVDWVIDSDLVVFNFPDAVNVTMNSSAFQIANMEHWSTTVDAWVGERGMVERLAMAEKVVYNFPNARSIEADQALIQGTVLAPDAAFTGVGFGDAGHIYGHIVAKQYVARGSFTIHAFALSHWVYDIVEDALSKQTGQGAVTLRHYLYFNGEPTSIRAHGGEFLLEDEAGRYFDGKGGFVAEAGQAAVYITGPDGYTQIQDVPLGEYTLVKAAAPDGFVLNDFDAADPYTYARYPVKLEVEEETVSVVRYSEPALTDLHFKKVDAVTGEGLPGAVFTIVREQDEYQDATVGERYTSGQDGTFTSYNVPVGVYHMVEVEPPQGYALLDGGEFSFAVVWEEQSGGLVVQTLDGDPLTATRTQPLELPDREGSAGNTVMLIKYAGESDEPGVFYTLPDARFSLYQYNELETQWNQVEYNAVGEEIDIVTNQYGYYRIDGLPDGRYRVVEVQSPAGYMPANLYTDDDHSNVFPGGYSYEFVFTDRVSFYTAYLPNKAWEAEVSVEVWGMLLGERQRLSGAAFRLEHLLNDGRTWEELFSSENTDGEGSLLLGTLPAGSYRLTQIKAARGFRPLVSAEIRFFVAFDNEGNPVLEAVHNGSAVHTNTHPVALENGRELRFSIENASSTCDYLVYKIDGDYSTGTDGEGKPVYLVDYLENAVFRLRRRQSARNVWQDYGGAFTSADQFTGKGQPLLDSYGNHIAAAAFEGGLMFGEYQLVEIHPPEGFRPGSEAEVILDDGTTGYQIHLFTITEAMAEAGELSTYTAANYADMYSMPFRFRLVDGRDHSLPLDGGEFALYHCEEDHVHDTTLDWDSCWVKSTPALAESGSDGVISFDDLVSGDYLLRQDEAPAGYRIPSVLWLLTVDAGNGAVDIRMSEGPARNMFLSTGDSGIPWLLPGWESFVLPGTGGSGTARWTIGGLLLLLVAAIAIKINKKEEKL